MSDATATNENESPPAGQGDDNKTTNGGSSTKTRSTRRREQAQRKKTREAAALAAAANTILVRSSFVGDDPDLPTLDWMANVAVIYTQFKKEMARHAGKRDPLMSTVIEQNSDADSLAEIKQRYGGTIPDPARNITVDADGDTAANLTAKDKVRYETELWEYRTRFQAQLKAENSFKTECSKFYNVVMGQISQLVEQRLDALPDFDRDVKSIRSLGGLFAALDQVVLGNEKDEFPAVRALKLIFGVGTRQSRNQSLPDFNREFESRLGLLEPKLGMSPEDGVLLNLMSPVLACAPYFAEEKLHKSYAECTSTERAGVHKIAADHVKASLFLLVSRNPAGGTNAEMVKEIHN